MSWDICDPSVVTHPEAMFDTGGNQMQPGTPFILLKGNYASLSVVYSVRACARARVCVCVRRTWSRNLRGALCGCRYSRRVASVYRHVLWTCVIGVPSSTSMNTVFICGMHCVICVRICTSITTVCICAKYACNACAQRPSVHQSCAIT